MIFRNRLSFENSIATKLLKIVFSVYLGIAVAVTLSHMVMEYFYQKGSITGELKTIQRTFEKGLAVDIWQMNRKSLESRVLGMLEIPVIVGTKITDAKGQTIVRAGIVSQGDHVGDAGLQISLLGLEHRNREVPNPQFTKRNRYKLDTFTHQFPITYSYSGKTAKVGDVTLYSNTSVIYERVKLQFFLLIVNAVLKTVALWAIFLYFSNSILRRPLAALTNAAQKVSLDNLDTFEVDVEVSDQNEIKILETAFNAMIRNLQQSINEQKNTELAIQEAFELNKKIISDSPIGILLYDQNGQCVEANQSAADLVGTSRERVLMQNYNQLDSWKRSGLLQAVRNAILRNESERHELKVNTTFGKQISMDCFLVPFIKEGSSHLLLMVADITERHQAERELRAYKDELERKVDERTTDYKRAKEEAESANLAKSEFLANISHELRNPMHQILSYAKYGIEKIDKPKEKLWHYFNQTRKAADRLMLLLNDLLDLSKMEAGKFEYKMEWTNLYQLVNEAVSELKPFIEEKNLSLDLIDPPIPAKVHCDYYKIGQVMRNLLSNAIKFTPENRKLVIELASYNLNLEGRPHSAVKLSVRDQGVGIPETELSSVFDKFTQSSKTKTGAGGTGLGLAICQEIIKAHGGMIWADNNPECGVTVSFVVPYQRQGAPTPVSGDRIPDEGSSVGNG